MAFSIVGKPTPKRRRAAMQAALYHARANRIERIEASEPDQTPVSSKWNVADKTADISLSNGALTASCTDSSDGGVRGVIGHNSGKVMLRFEHVTLGDSLDYVGVGAITNVLGLAQGSQDQAILVFVGTTFSGDGSSVENHAGFPDVGPDATVDLAIDFTAQKYWFRLNGGDWNISGTANPATGTEGFGILATGKKYPYVRLTTTSAHVTLNTVPDNLPAGFSVWG